MEETNYKLKETFGRNRPSMFPIFQRHSEYGPKKSQQRTQVIPAKQKVVSQKEEITFASEVVKSKVEELSNDSKPRLGGRTDGRKRGRS